jgi:hypothetical protein
MRSPVRTEGEHSVVETPAQGTLAPSRTFDSPTGADRREAMNHIARISALPLLVAGALAVSGCAKDWQTGGLIGGTAGAVVGSATGLGTATGAVLGGAAGAVIADQKDKDERYERRRPDD